MKAVGYVLLAVVFFLSTISEGVARTVFGMYGYNNPSQVAVDLYRVMNLIMGVRAVMNSAGTRKAVGT